MVAVRMGAEGRVDGGDEVGEEDVGEGVGGGAGATPGGGRRGGGRRCVAGARRVAAVHDDDHGLGLLLGEEVVEDEVHAALVGPAALVFAGAVLKVEDGVARVGIGIVIRRRIDAGAAVIPRHFRDVPEVPDLAVGDGFGGVEVRVGAGDVDAAGLTGPAEEGFGGRVVD